MGRADLHIHTSDGDGLDSIERVLDYVEARAGLDVIAVTEHDDLRPGLRARELAARRGLRTEVVPGVEVTTLQGHLVALFLESPVPSLRRVEETVGAVWARGGVCFVPHPFSWLTRSIGPSALDRLSASGLLPDGIELVTRAAVSRGFAARARRLNRLRFGLAPIGAPDAHNVEAIGSAYTEFEGATASDLRAAILAGTVRAAAGPAAPLSPRRALRVLALPVSGLRATPRKLGWRRTAWSFVSRYVS